MFLQDLQCVGDERRERVRRDPVYSGIDTVELGAGPRKLVVRFLGTAPKGLQPGNLSIEGGVRIRGLRVVALEGGADPSCVEVVLDRVGDGSPYVLRLVALDENGFPTDGRMPYVDPRFDRAEFSFAIDCEREVDCLTEQLCPPSGRDDAELSLLAKDYETFRRLILDRLSAILPDWKERHEADLGIALVELLAYVGDHLSYTQDAVATEAYLDTARLRTSVRRHVVLMDYAMHEGNNARAWLALDLEGRDHYELDTRGLHFLASDPTRLAAPEGPEPLPEAPTFLALRPPGEFLVVLRQARNAIRIHTWGERECCLAEGATSATLVEPGRGGAEEPGLDLAPGDILIFEEVLGARTGSPADADPARRHAVRLTEVSPLRDPLEERALVEVRWDAEDALPFPLCLATRTDAPDCRWITDVSVARGNVILVDHGSPGGETVPGAPPGLPDPSCDPEGCVPRGLPRRRRYRPALETRRITFCEAARFDLPARRQLRQDPRRALPALVLRESGPSPRTPWRPVVDLLSSGPEDRHFVLEVDDEERGWLRFGDGEFGALPPPGVPFQAALRVGSGPEGNVGAEAIRTVRGLPTGIEIGARNPLPAVGGTGREDVDQVKQLAPWAARRERVRAVTPRDYAWLAQQHPDVQQAAASLRWGGCNTEVWVAIDPLDAAARGDERLTRLLLEVKARLEPFRRIGHTVRVGLGRTVALRLELRVCVRPDYVRGEVRAAILAHLGSRVRPDGSLGLFHPDRLSFGDEVPLSPIVAEVQALPGVDSVTVMRFERLFEGPAGELEEGVLRLAPLEIPRLDANPQSPEHGVLGLDMRGGR